MKKFLRLLWPGHYSGFAKCRNCGVVRDKTSMHYDANCGWFCSHEEFEVYWQLYQL
jgi:hypothetical protein